MSKIVQSIMFHLQSFRYRRDFQCYRAEKLYNKFKKKIIIIVLTKLILNEISVAKLSQ